MSKCVMTSCGPVQGTNCQWPGIVAFNGIRYATAERFAYPQMVTTWEGTYDASAYGNCCYQPRAFYDEAKMPEKAFYYHEFREGETYTYSEDCLFLNIWTPENADEQSRLPVLLYIHGGGFTGGCGHEKHFDGPVWPTKDVVAVTINYRLGPLGFLCLPDLERRDGRCGNYGLEDQLAALEWVHKNIRAFGGNPNNITIMGQSAGAMSVQQLCLSPKTDGLIAKAVMSSGGGVSKMMKTVPASSRFAFWERVSELAGCSTLQELTDIEVAKLFDAWQAAKKENPKNGMAASPVIDGKLVVMSGSDALENGMQKDIPYLTGSNSEDIMPPIIFKMAKDYCRAQADQKKQHSYTWFFDRRLPGDDCGAWHSADLWYWFGTLSHCWRPMTDKDTALSEEMVSALTNFCRTGDPNGSGLDCLWLQMERGQNKVLRFGEQPTHMGGVSMAKLTKTMVSNRAVGE